MDDLKRCPYCGSNRVLVDVVIAGPLSINQSGYFGHCMNCGARGPNEMNTERAATMWNLRRTPDEFDALQRGYHERTQNPTK